MKTCLKSETPDLLSQYQTDNPNSSWEQFKNECQQGYDDVQKQLQKDQGNLCCYCEIDTKHGLGIGTNDFRVEHFYPKSKSDENNNWALDWKNMLGCCHGGSERYVTDANIRFTELHGERHSDVLKGENVWNDTILNPLDIPSFPILFRHQNDGGFLVREENCVNAGIDIEKAKNCLDAEKLNLNSKKLKSLRKSVLDALREQIQNQLSIGMTIEQAMFSVVEAQLRKNYEGNFPAFFTTIRSYFGEIAEKHLRQTGYQG